MNIGPERMGSAVGSFKRFKMLPKRSKWWVVVRYTFFQIPDMAIFVLILILIHRWVNLPPWLTWGLVSLWVIKDILMFPFVWSAYKRSPSGGGQSLVGTEGIAEERLAPSGYVRLHDELWQAEVTGRGTPIEKGERVMVQGVNGLTLLVQPTPKMMPFFPTP